LPSLQHLGLENRLAQRLSVPVGKTENRPPGRRQSPPLSFFRDDPFHLATGLAPDAWLRLPAGKALARHHQSDLSYGRFDAMPKGQYR